TRGQAVRLPIGMARDECSQTEGEIVERLLWHAHQAGNGPDPKVVLAILKQVTNAVADEALTGCVTRPASSLEPGQTAIVGPDPQYAFRIHSERGNVFTGKPVFLVE